MAGRHKKIITHIFPTFAFGGQQVRLAALANAFGDDFEHHVYALNGDVSAASLFARNITVKMITLSHPKSSLVSLSGVTALRRRIEASDAQLLCTYNWGAIEGVMANLFGPRLAHIHFEDGFGPDESIDRQKLKRVLMRRLMLRRSLVVVPSKKLRDLALSRWRLPASNIHYLPNGVDIGRFTRPERSYEGESIRIGAVGALRREKNFSRLLRAFETMQSDAQATLEIVGDGDELAALEDEASQCAKYDRIAFPGRNEHPETSYAGFDVFAMSSDTEQMPLSLIEAMASGLPVAATDVGDIRDMVAPENQRFITPKDDEAALAASLEALAGDADLRRRLGQANARKAEQVFSLDKMVDAHRRLYLSLAR